MHNNAIYIQKFLGSSRSDFTEFTGVYTCSLIILSSYQRILLALITLSISSLPKSLCHLFLFQYAMYHAEEQFAVLPLVAFSLGCCPLGVSLTPGCIWYPQHFLFHLYHVEDGQPYSLLSSLGALKYCVLNGILRSPQCTQLGLYDHIILKR